MTYDELCQAVVEACIAMATALDHPDPVVGFALLTDDDVRTLFAAAVRRSFVEAEGADSLYVAVDWPEEPVGGEELLAPCSAALAALAEGEGHAERAFSLLVDALGRARSRFPDDVFVAVLSTDPSDLVELWEREGVRQLNSLRHFESFVDAMR